MTMSKFFNTSFYSQKLRTFFAVPKIELVDPDSSEGLLARMFNLSEDEMVDLTKDDVWIVTKNGEDLWTCPSDQDANLLVSVLKKENPEHIWDVRIDEIVFGTNDDRIEDSSQLNNNIFSGQAV
jgi:hypothetical protein